MTDRIPGKTIPIQPIHLMLKGENAANAANIANAASPADAKLNLDTHFQPVAARMAALGATPNDLESLNVISEFLDAATLLDGSYGVDGSLPVEDAADAADEALRAAASLRASLIRYLSDDEVVPLETAFNVLDAVTIGIGYWCMRHALDIATPEPIVNALANRANAANTRQETAATYAMMQGFVAHLSPQLSSDLERSNPERPWRLLNVNFAITAIRTGDAALMRFAFDQLNRALPDECAGFYNEAYTLASQPGFPLESRSLIEAEHRKFARAH
jgi:hypothetical protein